MIQEEIAAAIDECDAFVQREQTYHQFDTNNDNEVSLAQTLSFPSVWRQQICQWQFQVLDCLLWLGHLNYEYAHTCSYLMLMPLLYTSWDHTYWN